MVFGRRPLLSYLSFTVYVDLTSLFPWEVVEADTYWIVFWNRDSLFYGDYSALWQRGRVGAAIFVRRGPVVNTWSTVGRSSVPFADFRNEIKREHQCFFTWLWTWVLLVAMFSDMCSSTSWCGEKEMIHTFRGRRGIDRGRRRASWFPHSLRLPGSSSLLHFCPWVLWNTP